MAKRSKTAISAEPARSYDAAFYWKQEMEAAVGAAETLLQLNINNAGKALANEVKRRARLIACITGPDALLEAFMLGKAYARMCDGDYKQDFANVRSADARKGRSKKAGMREASVLAQYDKLPAAEMNNREEIAAKISEKLAGSISQSRVEKILAKHRPLRSRK